MKSAFLLTTILCALFCQVSSSPVDLQTSKSDVRATKKSNVNLANCSTPDDVLELKSFSVSPEQAVPGKEITISATGTLKETIQEGAYADVTVKLGLVTMLKKRFDICEELIKNNNELRCPLEKGDINFTQTVTLPITLLPTKYTVLAKAYTANDENDIGCATITASFSPFRP